ncbi:dnaJ homolog subfamily C member 13-like isoform X4 [Homarus americanus]|uniref:dnaJ homolog subfamily C member 13-like isoform X4 n=1 Tax=Homarus americanus TaxID=6706 RepID=UPI001C47DFD4|nr:dnaJ homolog subfamily C member 13-like isoform X4 [Homarus americanus]
MGTNNQDVACYLVTKHSAWKGKYKRIFSVGNAGITTYNPGSMEVTNQWYYHDFLNITPALKGVGQVPNEFIITMRKGKKVDHMRFSSEHRTDIISEALVFRHNFAEGIIDNLRANAQKVHWSEARHPVVLEVTPCSVDQLDAATGAPLASYMFKDIEALVPVSDIPGGLCIQSGGFGRLHIFSTDRRDEILKKVEDNAKKYIGIAITAKKVCITLQLAMETRVGKYSGDEHITSLCEFLVHKVSHRHNDPVRRTICVSETCLLERDPNSYAIVTLRPLSEVFALVRHLENPQKLTVEYIRGGNREYTSSDRDSLLASLVDGVRASGNLDVHVRMTPTERGKRLGPLEVPVDEEVESMHLKFLQQPPPGWTFAEAIERFNANVSYSGLLHAVTGEALCSRSPSMLVGRKGLFAENKERLITGGLGALVLREGDQATLPPEEVEAQFHALRRLVASKAGFACLTSLPGFREKVGVKVVKALQRNDDGVNHAALDMLCALMQPMHDYPDLKQEQLNKASLLASAKFQEKLLENWVYHVSHGTGALVVSAMLDFMTFSLCAPYSETTDGAHFDRLLEMVADNGRSLYRLFQHPSLAIVKGAGLVMKAVIEEGENDIPMRMQLLALTEGALPRHLFTALFTQTSDGRLLTHRQLSRHLVSLWAAENQLAVDLLGRTVPPGLLAFLESKETVSLDDIDRLNTRDNLKIAEEDEERNKKNQVLDTLDRAYKSSVKKVEHLVERHMDKIETVERHLQKGAKHMEAYYESYLEKHVDDWFALQHWRSHMRREKSAEEKFRERPLVLRKRREKLKATANWPLFYYKFNQDHALPNLLWNYKTREELRVALEAEMRAFNEDRDVRGGMVIAWNHHEFEVSYPSLKDEIKIGDYYLRILLEQENNTSEEDSPIRKSYEFFNDLYHRFLLTPKVAMKCLCLQAMALVYGLHHKDIGQFNDTRYIVTMLSRTCDKLERDRLLLFLNKLILEKSNVREVVEAGGVRILSDLLTLAHLHVSRAVMATQTNVIEASPDMARDSEKEWYYQGSNKERAGPYSFKELKEIWSNGTLSPKTLCWAQGMDGWHPLTNIPQLKWSMAATGNAVMTESDLATLILNMLITMCRYFPSRTEDGAVIRPLPRIKRLLSDSLSLPHIVQLLLTFDPVLVEKVSTLMVEIMQDNPNISTVYTTGVFYFILMYMGSNVLPIGYFLHMSHMQQSFRAEENSGGDIMQQSILGQILPEAMVCYLENYGADKFAEIFLGEFDTPEVIWSNEMRRHMIEKLASHLADFTPRLMSNTRALYQYCAIPHITYPQLQHELFCDIYYLKHLSDVERFPDWPIKDPVALLKRVLAAWQSEVEKQPSSMTVDDAYHELGLEHDSRHDDAKIRKAYFRLAQKYHPDKNPDGRDKFERVNKAYEFLCSRSAHAVDGPDPKNILLVIRTQSILFSRYKEVLAPYKYSGYPMLIKTIQLEADDEQLFSKETSLLAAAAELTYHTINCSSLNAEELRREKGLEVLQGAYNRCVSVLNASSKPGDVAVQVCTNIARCYTAAASFPMCREKLIEMSHFIKDLCHTLYFKDLEMTQFTKDLCHMLSFKSLLRVCSVGVECVSALAIDQILQMNLLQAGILWHLLLFLFNYDYTLDEGGVSKSEDSNQQELSNRLAKLALYACGRLAGLFTEENKITPANTVIQGVLQKLLTPYIVSLISSNSSEEVLKILTSNVETPYLIWDNGTRSQLNDFLATNQQAHVRTGQSDPEYGATFEFEAHKDELIIGGVFIRIYNEQPSFPIQKAKELTLELLQYIGGETQYVHSLLSLSAAPVSNPRLARVGEALRALVNVIKNNPGVEMQCIGHFRLLFSLLRLEGCVAVQQSVLAVVEGVTGNADCVSDIASSEVLVYLMLALHSQALVPNRLMSLNILHALMSNTKIVKEALNKGAVMYLLNIFCSSDDGDVREKTAELMGKMTCDKLVGPRVRLILLKILPAALADQMRDSPSTSVHLYEAQHENPELIWTDDSRQKVSGVVSRLVEEIHDHQCKDPSAIWKFPEEVTLSSTSGEVVVGGVFLRLLVANPSWVLRKPKTFVSDLFDALLDQLAKGGTDGDTLELVVSTVITVLSAQRNLLEYLPQLGHIPRVVSLLFSKNLSVARAATHATHQFTFSQVCFNVLEGTEVVAGLVSAMKLRPDVVGVACEALHNLFSGGISATAFVDQGLRANVIPYLLSLLESKLDAKVQKPASTKAQIVTCLKTMAASPQHAEEVNALLAKSAIWLQYRDQKHDLFIETSPTAGYLMGGTPGVAGFLTQGSSRAMPSTPPSVNNTHRQPELP